MYILVLKFQAWQFGAKPRFLRLLNDQNTCDKSVTFLVVTCLEYRFLQSGLVGSRFLKV